MQASLEIISVRFLGLKEPRMAMVVSLFLLGWMRLTWTGLNAVKGWLRICTTRVGGRVLKA